MQEQVSLAPLQPIDLSKLPRTHRDLADRRRAEILGAIGDLPMTGFLALLIASCAIFCAYGSAAVWGYPGSIAVWLQRLFLPCLSALFGILTWPFGRGIVKSLRLLTGETSALPSLAESRPLAEREAAREREAEAWNLELERWSRHAQLAVEFEVDAKYLRLLNRAHDRLAADRLRLTAPARTLTAPQD
jgi:hypothetical protein